MRSMKKTSLAFGLVNIPVRMYKAVDDHDVGFHQHHDADMGRIGYRKYCKECGESVDQTNIVRGVDHEGSLVVITDEDLAGLDEEQDTRMEVVQFAQADDIDPVMYELPYYLEPDGSSEGYSLLRQVLTETDRVAIVSFVLRSTTRLGLLRVMGNTLVLQTMRWPDEVRNAGELKIPDHKVKIKPQALKMAHALVESMLMEFDPSEYVDTYTERLRELIAAKAGEGEFVTEAHDLDEDSDEVQDIMAALEASIKRHPAGKKRPAAKKAPARTPRKAPARRKKIA